VKIVYIHAYAMAFLVFVFVVICLHLLSMSLFQNKCRFYMFQRLYSSPRAIQMTRIDFVNFFFPALKKYIKKYMPLFLRGLYPFVTTMNLHPNLYISTVQCFLKYS